MDDVGGTFKALQILGAYFLAGKSLGISSPD